MKDLAQAARDDARRAAEQEAEYEQTREPDSRATSMAAELSRMLGVEVDPRKVVDRGYHHPYYVYTVELFGLTFTGHYLWDTNGAHRTSSPWRVARRRFGRTQKRAVSRIGDLGGWL